MTPPFPLKDTENRDSRGYWVVDLTDRRPFGDVAGKIVNLS